MTVAKAVSVPQSTFMLGIGGMGMAPLAIFLAQAGCVVHGVDDSMQAPVRILLESNGVKIVRDVPNEVDVEAVIFSSAIKFGHPLLEQSRRSGVPVMRRGEMLAQLSKQFRFLAVAGSHGKTTTTGMLVHLLKQSDYRFNYVLGARFRKDAMQPAGYDPESDWLIAEVDESDGTIEGFNPEITLFVNFDWDHPDKYSDAAQGNEAFSRLAQRTSGTIIIPDLHANVLSGGLSASIQAVGFNDSDFNTCNGKLATVAAEAVTGTRVECSLQAFPGIARRQDVLYQDNATVMVADYAHHPTEISALLKYARNTWGGPVVTVFQPHRYSRTAVFAGEFAKALASSDEVILLPVYAASEEPRGDGLTDAIQKAGDARWTVTDSNSLPRAISQSILDDKCRTVLFVGAGDIDKMADSFVADWLLKKQLLNGVSSDTLIKLGEPLARRTTLRVGGPARFFAEPASAEDLVKLLQNARLAALPVFFLGRGSNLIVSDAGFDGLVITLTHDTWHNIELLDDHRLCVGAGVRLKELCGFAAKHDLSGFEFLEGIPGTVGGSLRMNAGAMGGWIFDVIESVTFVTHRGEVQTWDKEQFHIGYRQCAELKEAIAIEAIFVSGQSIESENIRRQMDTYAAKRKESQPREPSAGCIFKNPEGNFAGKLVDELGLKGSSVGAAEVSSIHGNFIINRGGATSEDVLGLVKQVRDTIQRERGICLEPEVLLLGASWEEVLA